MVRGAYLAAVGAGWVSPSEFWRLTPAEFWWLYEAKNPAGAADKPDKWADLYALLD